MEMGEITSLDSANDWVLAGDHVQQIQKESALRLAGERKGLITRDLSKVIEQIAKTIHAGAVTSASEAKQLYQVIKNIHEKCDDYSIRMQRVTRGLAGQEDLKIAEGHADQEAYAKLYTAFTNDYIAAEDIQQKERDLVDTMYAYLIDRNPSQQSRKAFMESVHSLAKEHASSRKMSDEERANERQFNILTTFDGLAQLGFASAKKEYALALARMIEEDNWSKEAYQEVHADLAEAAQAGHIDALQILRAAYRYGDEELHIKPDQAKADQYTEQLGESIEVADALAGHEKAKLVLSSKRHFTRARALYIEIVKDPSIDREMRLAVAKELGAKAKELVRRLDPEYRELEDGQLSKEQLSLYAAGFLFEHGAEEVLSDPAVADMLYKAAGVGLGFAHAGRMQEKSGNYSAALAHYERSCAFGEQDAYYPAVRILELGLHGSKDSKKARELMRQGPESDPRLLFREAEALNFDDRNTKQAAQRYQEAASLGDISSMARLQELGQEQGAELYTQMMQQAKQLLGSRLERIALPKKPGEAPTPVEALDELHRMHFLKGADLFSDKMNKQMQTLLRKQVYTLADGGKKMRAALLELPAEDQWLVGSVAALSKTARSANGQAALSAMARVLFQKQSPTRNEIRVAQLLLEQSAPIEEFSAGIALTRLEKWDKAAQRLESSALQGNQRAGFQLAQLIENGLVAAQDTTPGALRDVYRSYCDLKDPQVCRHLYWLEMSTASQVEDQEMRSAHLDQAKLYFEQAAAEPPKKERPSYWQIFYPLGMKILPSGFRFAARGAKYVGFSGAASTLKTMEQMARWKNTQSKMDKSFASLQSMSAKTFSSLREPTLRQIDFRTLRSFAFSCVNIFTLAEIPLSLSWQAAKFAGNLLPEELSEYFATEISQAGLYGAQGIEKSLEALRTEREFVLGSASVIQLLATLQVFTGLVRHGADPMWVKMHSVEVAAAVARASRSILYFSSLMGHDFQEEMSEWMPGSIPYLQQSLAIIATSLGLWASYMYWRSGTGSTAEAQYQTYLEKEQDQAA